MTVGLASWLFLRLLGCIYLAAFVSLAVQIKGLAGREGILPAVDFLKRRARYSGRRFHRLPTLCWWSGSDAMLLFLCWGGAVLALLLVVGLAPILVLTLLWIFYLSLFNVCRLFLAYQWDILLLEAGFLAIFLAPIEVVTHFPPVTEPPRVIVWLLWWLLFRLMFSSGLVKWRSKDPAWRRLTALRHHYETQPLPTPLAWYAHQLPPALHRFCAVILFTIEVGVPVLLVGPAPLRHLAAGLFILLMILIQLTGNYSFFNLLGIALSLLVLEDRSLVPVLHGLWPSVAFPKHLAATPPVFVWLSVAIAMLILPLSLEPLWRLFPVGVQPPRWLDRLFDAFAPFHLVNSYGLFSMMTTERPEIIVEGSDDGENWRRYEFKWKPGDVKRAPRFAAPHQPRLDWQMWFAAIGFCENNPWFQRFLDRLREGSPAVLSLLRRNPFPNAPPRYLRALVYDYRFTNRQERRVSGAWWRCEERGLYCPVVTGEGVS
jgi:hypothetical protein